MGNFSYMSDYRNKPSAARRLVFTIFGFWRFLNKYKVWIKNYNCFDRVKEPERIVDVAHYVLIMLQKTEPIYNVYFSRYSKKSATILVPINVAIFIKCGESQF